MLRQLWYIVPIVNVAIGQGIEVSSGNCGDIEGTDRGNRIVQ